MSSGRKSETSILRRFFGVVLFFSILLFISSHFFGFHYSDWSKTRGLFLVGIWGGNFHYYNPGIAEFWPWRIGLHWYTPTGLENLISMFSEFHFVPIVNTGIGFRFGTYLIPLWILIIPPAVTYYLLLRRDRRKLRMSGHCPCGYNLTGNESGTCPECGAAITASTEAAKA